MRAGRRVDQLGASWPARQQPSTRPSIQGFRPGREAHRERQGYASRPPSARKHRPCHAGTNRGTAGGSGEKLVVKYPSEGGYSQGDTWDVYVGADDRVQEFVYHRGGPKKPSVVIAIGPEFAAVLEAERPPAPADALHGWEAELRARFLRELKSLFRQHRCTRPGVGVRLRRARAGRPAVRDRRSRFPATRP
jgi:hypothetical protein